jgi:hypothetical protein
LRKRNETHKAGAFEAPGFAAVMAKVIYTAAGVADSNILYFDDDDELTLIMERTHQICCRPVPNERY